ncbi:hypothetical protein LOAG_05389 [Loa loa]|uniref:NtA domain-containing protein n=1 Tax=Loa loa TaxID=7209 RepID=A0A1S0U1R9_LOALO|nr:hypothetical protein LOAG_05389 [Loa loa]EFO23099.1 hypothetical protein LOAG_05389 [Loa loa]
MEQFQDRWITITYSYSPAKVSPFYYRYLIEHLLALPQPDNFDYNRNTIMLTTIAIHLKRHLRVIHLKRHLRSVLIKLSPLIYAVLIPLYTYISYTQYPFLLLKKRQSSALNCLHYVLIIETATVRVKRIFKGFNIINSRKKIVIHGLGGAQICRSVLHERDTKIILLNELNGLFYLNSSLNEPEKCRNKAGLLTLISS